MDESLSVLVVDDHAGVRAGLVSLIDSVAPALRAVGAAATPEEALSLNQRLQPHVVLLDIDLGGEDGLALIPALRAAGRCEVVVLTSLTDPRAWDRAMTCGAHACLHKTASAGELLGYVLTARPAIAGGGMSCAVQEQVTASSRQ